MQAAGRPVHGHLSERSGASALGFSLVRAITSHIELFNLRFSIIFTERAVCLLPNF